MIVPCFNEAARLQQKKFLDFRLENCDLRFLFVNDGSSDETQSVLDAMSAQGLDRIESLRLKHNVGKAEAVRQGMLHGLKANPDFIGFLDADLATSLEELPRFFEVMEANPTIKLVMGSRIRLLGRTIERNAAWSSNMPESLGLPAPGGAHTGLGDVRAIAIALRTMLRESLAD